MVRPLRTTAAAALALVAGLTVSTGAQPPAPAPSSPAVNIARGQYLVERVAMCGECHSWHNAAGEIVPRDMYLGGPLQFRPLPGWADRAPRITGLPGYTDAQAVAMLTQGGVGRGGVVLRRPMPRYRMTEDDARDVIAFLRSAP